MMRWCCCFTFIFLMLAACDDKNAGPAKPARDSTVYFPYVPVNSNSYEKGRDLNAKIVLQVWKQFETGNVSNEAAHFADSLRIILPHKIYQGTKDSVLNMYRKEREKYQTMQCFVHSWMPVRMQEEGDEMVYLWGLYDGTLKNGDRDYKLVHEIWRFDKNGRIREMEQFKTHPH